MGVGGQGRAYGKERYKKHFSRKNPKGKDNLEDPVVDGVSYYRIKTDINGVLYVDSCCSVYGPMAGYCEHSNEALGTIE
jgi:hypothetical protein